MHGMDRRAERSKVIQIMNRYGLPISNAEESVSKSSHSGPAFCTAAYWQHPAIAYVMESLMKVTSPLYIYALSNARHSASAHPVVLSCWCRSTWAVWATVGTNGKWTEC